MLKNSMKSFDQTRPPFGDQNQGAGRLMPQPHLVQQTLDHLALSLEIMNSKFETVVSKLNSMQKNYEELDRQQKDM